MEMWNRYRDICVFILLLCSGFSFLVSGARADNGRCVNELDSLKSVLSQTADPHTILPVMFRISNFYPQDPEEVLWLKRCYELAVRIDSIPAAYEALKGLTCYYYNSGERDSLLFWGSRVDSISRSRNEYPDVLFDFKSYSCQDLLWTHNYELALNEALSEYHLASKLKHSYGLTRCSESLGLIYQTVRRDSDAVVAFQEGLDMLEDVPFFREEVKADTKMRITCYQAESAIKVCSPEQTLRILDNYRQAIEDLDSVNQRLGTLMAVKRDYWLLCCYYADFYIRENRLDEAKQALDKAEQFVGNAITEDDYVQSSYLVSQAHYYRKTGNTARALELIDEVIREKPYPSDLTFKIEILKEQGRLKEALELYDELFSLNVQRNKETFFRQINQLRTLHELNSHEAQAHEMELNREQMMHKQQLFLFFSVVALILFLLSYVLYRYYRRARQLKNELLKEKQSLLESETKLLREKEKAEEASRMKSAFVANMSHEIRTPLNAIVGFSDLLVNDSGDPEEADIYASVIKNNTEQLLNLVNDVLDLSRMESGDLHFKFNDYPLIECCRSALDSVCHRIPEGVKLTFTPDEIPVTLHTDKLRLQQILTNLLTNSAKFTQEGEINLAYKVDEENKAVHIFVTDTGCGIPKEKQAAVFRRFEKLDDYKSGAGLGLSICTLIADRLGGTLSIDPAYENGARFILTHPYETLSSTYSQ